MCCVKDNPIYMMYPILVMVKVMASLQVACFATDFYFDASSP
jgi:hypothetical protein